MNHACIRLDVITSHNRDICSGVRQSRIIMSSQMYNVYVDELTVRMMNKNLCCTIRDYAYSTIYYVYDIILMSASRRKMHRMIEVVIVNRIVY